MFKVVVADSRPSATCTAFTEQPAEIRPKASLRVAGDECCLLAEQCLSNQSQAAVAMVVTKELGERPGAHNVCDVLTAFAAWPPDRSPTEHHRSPRAEACTCGRPGCPCCRSALERLARDSLDGLFGTGRKPKEAGTFQGRGSDGSKEYESMSGRAPLNRWYARSTPSRVKSHRSRYMLRRLIVGVDQQISSSMATSSNAQQPKHQAPTMRRYASALARSQLIAIPTCPTTTLVARYTIAKRTTPRWRQRSLVHGPPTAGSRA